MKFTVLVHTTIVISITLGHANTISGTEVDDEESTCNPYSALFMWYMGSGEDNSFFQQMRLLVMLISEFPENTSVSMITIGAKDDITLSFRKQGGNTNWSDKILQLSGNTSIHATSYTEKVRMTISNFHRSKSTDAQIVYLQVDSKSEIHDEENGFEELSKMKTFVIFAEVNTSIAETWVKLAINTQHFVVWDSRSEDEIEKTKNIILARSCQDSLFVCDTDNYWSSDRNRCNSCTYICTSTYKRQTEYCVNACPFFHQSLLGNDVTTGDGLNNESGDFPNYESSQKHSGYVGFIFKWLFIIAIIVFTIAVCMKRKQISKKLSSAKKWKADSLKSRLYHPQAEQNNDIHYNTHSYGVSSGPLGISGNLTSRDDLSGKSDIELKVMSY
ncbi:uncharacterized protein LOC132750918 [Ruditapes philippinarum]|uniref:uncharacterized protein LOC132750918 n=1 Tax=Ruditapes philippinarum TaxID=129788 RepID=UPI00295BB34E|nr:uncharacterized protein LOC132750918 [Ruditapes philippinarum]